MKIRTTGKKYFYFKFDENDYRRYGYDHCRKFINAMQKEIPAGDRFWIKKAGLWAIQNKRRKIFNKLIDQYLFDNKQKDLFNE